MEVPHAIPCMHMNNNMGSYLKSPLLSALCVGSCWQWQTPFADNVPAGAAAGLGNNHSWNNVENMLLDDNIHS